MSVKSLRGATLLELLLSLTVIAVVGVVVSTALLNGYQQWSFDQRVKDWKREAKTIESQIQWIWTHVYRDVFAERSEWIELSGEALEDGVYKRILSLSLRVGRPVNDNFIEEGWVTFKQSADGAWVVKGLDLFDVEISPNGKRIGGEFDLFCRFDEGGWQGALSPRHLFNPAILRLKLRPKDLQLRKADEDWTFFLIYPSLAPILHEIK